jgi:RimJ/RimL family protein N-acetyltransferase
MKAVDSNRLELPIPIWTPRLLIRPIQKEDGAIVLDYKRDSWTEFLKWMIWTHPPSIEVRTVQDDELFCEYKHDQYVSRTDLTYLAIDQKAGRMVGVGGLHKCEWDLRIFTLGFSVRTSETGKGYATEIATALSKYAFSALAATKIRTLHAAGDLGSQRVIEKIGFEREGVLRQQHRLADGLVDEYHYGLLDPERLPYLVTQWGEKPTTP